MIWPATPKSAQPGAARLRCAIFILLCFACTHVFAQRSYFSVYDQDYGLNVGEIGALAQDDQGFIWIGAHRGLIRFDGRHFVAWAHEQFDETVYQLLHGRDDQLLLRTANGRGWYKTQHGLAPIIGPDGGPLTGLTSFELDSAEQLWAVIDDRLWLRDKALAWNHIERGLPSGEKVTRIFSNGDEIIVLTDQAAWRFRDGAAATEILRARDLWFATGDKHALWLATHFDSGMWRIDANGVHVLFRPPARAIDLRKRNDTVWLSMDRQLLGYEPDGSVRRIGIADGLPSGGPILIDREDSLWIGSFVGLLQFPQPDTWQWSEPEGLPLAHAYSVVEYEGVIFASTWGGLAHLDSRKGGRFISDFMIHGGIVCADSGHGVWTSDGTHLLTWRNDRFESVADLPAGAEISACAMDVSGRLWFATTQGLMHLASSEANAKLSTDLTTGVDQIWFDGNARMHVVIADRICRFSSMPTGPGTLQDCVTLPTVARANDLVQISPERTWLVANDGIFEFDGTRARRLYGNHLLDGGMTSSLNPAGNGDLWAAGAGVLQRIHPCIDCTADWQIREAPGRWQGLPSSSAVAATQSANGDLWIAGNRGIWRIPRGARDGPKNAPTIVPIRIAVDSQELAPEQKIELAPDARRLELEFAALSFRDRNLLRFRSRLGGQGDWSSTTRSAVLQFAALEPGDYRAEMSASLDGEHWSDTPAAMEFRVLPPWYRTWWARIVFLFVALALASWLYRLRIAALLRVERERTRIAMDLHDELGAGLGSIGMLAGVAVRDGLAVGEQRRLLDEIANVSGLLGSGLRSLVWSLRSGRAGLAELGAQIADHARRLFPGERPCLSVQLPQHPSDAPLPPELRRHVLLLALEALHNISRHADASQVVVVLSDHTEGSFSLSIADDGRGFDMRAESAGVGLESMQRRAAAINARLVIDSVIAHGTRIALDCPAVSRIA